MPKDISQAKKKSRKKARMKKDKNVKKELKKPIEKAPVTLPIPPTNIKKRLLSKAEQMKENLEAQPKVSVLIPLEKGEKKGAVQPFNLNGYRFTVPKGVMTMVPQQVAEMIRDRFNIELEVRSKSLGQQPERVREALE